MDFLVLNFVSRITHQGYGRTPGREAVPEWRIVRSGRVIRGSDLRFRKFVLRALKKIRTL